MQPVRALFKLRNSFKFHKNLLFAARNVKAQLSFAEGFTVDFHIFGKGRDPHNKREVFVGGYFVPCAVFERILRFQKNVHAVGMKLTRHHHRIDDGVFFVHKCAQSKFGPALTEVCCAAAEMGLQTKQMRLSVVRSENRMTKEFFAADLIAHLIVLVGPHVLADGGRQCVERQYLQPLCPFAVAGVGIQQLVGIHLLDDAAQFCALNGAQTRQAFVTCETFIYRSVILRQKAAQLLCVIGIRCAQQLTADSLAFEHHDKIDDVGLQPPMVERALPQLRMIVVIGALCLQDFG